uniref:Coiled-coil domain-containing protein 22 homolog n=1 Tax=Mucochytrium quahogii TaxID=96639 RepID=A0A7S2R8Z8_9STRA|mmetsp:Transcript_36935/g.60096  ORF Transcript_36935/g.60096 Transcript_36935/m.60096 type:complete len:568 (-) Transcript_36935:1620-3323(-)|eukprot:CAMPEP_0203759738 /NCGR_PEP_ID=MMETSP0098-20131031/12890_1 /ASSEMBLY_ACC=CAM_ASM_000208 /TAXON_ID=96639 /ORGANISM=" , Strain NY0313808BC1" /LENGTH=567 /DNA_ID=CAMNT_0050652907 /DNA_START=348 /DNA_END=2051 /DNA_ORIENTATION=-
MEDVDRGVVAVFEELGALGKGEHTSLVDIPAADLIKCVVRGLRQIGCQGLEEHSEVMSASISKRHKQCAGLAKILNDQGFSPECGYNQLLYPSERSTRDILMWLEERLDKAAGNKAEEQIQISDAPCDGLREKIQQSLRAWTRETWVIDLGVEYITKRQPLKTFSVARDQWVTKQFGQGQQGIEAIAPSVLEKHFLAKDTVADIHESQVRNCMKVALEREKVQRDDVFKLFHKAHDKTHRQAKFTRAARFGQDAPSDEHVEKVLGKEENSIGTTLADMPEQLLSRERQIAAFESRMKEIALREEKAKSDLCEVFEKQKNIDRGYNRRKTILELMPDASENIAKLAQLVEKSSRRLEQLHEEWEAHRAPIMEEIQALRSCEDNLTLSFERKQNAIRRMRRDIQDMSAQISSQKTKVEALEATKLKLPRNVDRALYTNRILDIIKQVRRQDGEIKRVIDDIQTVQKDINTVSEKLRRVEAITDDLLFQVSDEQRLDHSNTKAYRNLHDMRVLFDELIATAKEIGETQNEARDFSSRAENLKSRVSNENLERLLKDLSQIKRENESLQST